MDTDNLSDLALTKKVMNLEFKLQDAMRREKYYGKGSTTAILHTICNSLWIELDARTRHLRAFGIPLPKITQKPRVKAPREAKTPRIIHPYG